MITALNATLESDLRYALDVMEEYSHLGLNDESAGKLRAILVRQINDARAAISTPAATSERLPAPREKMFA